MKVFKPNTPFNLRANSIIGVTRKLAKLINKYPID